MSCLQGGFCGISRVTDVVHVRFLVDDMAAHGLRFACAISASILTELEAMLGAGRSPNGRRSHWNARGGEFSSPNRHTNRW